MHKSLNFDAADFEAVRSIALGFPETEDSLSHEGTPSIKVRGKLMCRLHESGEFIPIRLDFAIRDHYLASYPEFFHLPDHFKAYPYICMWKHDYQKALLEQSWMALASKRGLEAYKKQQRP